MADRAVLVVGAGDALGGAIARRFAREGYAAVIVRRHAEQLEPLARPSATRAARPIPSAPTRATKSRWSMPCLDRVEREIAPVEVCVFNIGANVRFPIAETTARVFIKVWEMACFAGFLAGPRGAPSA